MVSTPPPTPGGLITAPPGPGGSSEFRREAPDDRPERVGLLERRLVARARDHLEPGAGDAPSQLLRARDRRHLIVRTGDDERRRPDVIEQLATGEGLTGEQVGPTDPGIRLHLPHPP